MPEIPCERQRRDLGAYTESYLKGNKSKVLPLEDHSDQSNCLYRVS